MTRGAFLLLLGALALYYVAPSVLLAQVISPAVNANFDAIALALAGA